MDEGAAAAWSGPGPRLADLGEAGVLSRLLEARGAAVAGVSLGPGDDCAVLQPPPGFELVVSQDATVEGVDYRPGWISPRDLGSRAAAIALSDLAGMGADAGYLLVTVCAAATTAVADLLEIQAGILATAEATGAALVGGDLSGTEGPLVIDVHVGGWLPSGTAMRRRRERRAVARTHPDQGRDRVRRRTLG